MNISPTIHSVHGRILAATYGDPGAGANLSLAVPSRRRWRLLSLRFVFTADSNSANRFIRLALTDGAEPLTLVMPPSAVIANSTSVFNFALGLPFQDIVDVYFMLPLPFVLLGPGFLVTTAITDLQAGDQISSVFLTAEEWIDP